MGSKVKHNKPKPKIDPFEKPLFSPKFKQGKSVWIENGNYVGPVTIEDVPIARNSIGIIDDKNEVVSYISYAIDRIPPINKNISFSGFSISSKADVVSPEKVAKFKWELEKEIAKKSNVEETLTEKLSVQIKDDIDKLIFDHMLNPDEEISDKIICGSPYYLVKSPFGQFFHIAEAEIKRI